MLAKTRPDYRNELVRIAETTPRDFTRHTFDLDSVLAGIGSCENRGSVLPFSLQPECGCAELTECREGRGARTGRVTLQDCIACVVRSTS